VLDRYCSLELISWGEITVVASSSPDALYSVVDAGISGTVIVIAIKSDLFVNLRP
jgi:hypothetical protein